MEKNKLLVVVSSPISTVSGYGWHSRDLVRSIIKAKENEWDIRLESTKWGNCPMNALSDTDTDIVSRLVFSPLDRQPDIWIQVSVANEFKPTGKYNIGITAGIETTICDPSWIVGCNKMDLIIVPSNHSRTVLQNTSYSQIDKQTNKQTGTLKLTTPVEVLFEGVDLDVFKKITEFDKTIVDEMKFIKEQFAFLFVGHWLPGDLSHDRKDVGMLVRTFSETFKKVQNKPALILKTSGATFSYTDLNQLKRKIENIRSGLGINLPNIYIIHGDLTQAEMNSLYNHPKVKAMVSYTKGEGYGRPLAEFARTGKPIIVPNWSGHVDFIKPEHAVLLPGELKKVHQSAFMNNAIIKGSEWFYVDYKFAISALKDVYKNYKLYKEKSNKQPHYIKTNFSLEKMDKDFIELLDKNIQITTINTNLKLPKLKKVSK